MSALPRLSCCLFSICLMSLSQAEAGGYVYVAHSYYVSPPVFVAPVFTAPIPVAAPPVVYVSGYPMYAPPQPVMVTAPLVPAHVVSLPVLTVPTYAAPVYARPVVVSYGPRFHSYRSYHGPFLSRTREVIRY